MTDQPSRWRARAFDIDVLVALFGTPDQLAARAALTRKLRDMARDWLRLIEALVRRTLFIDALGLVSAATPALGSRRARRFRTAPVQQPDEIVLRRIPFPLLPQRQENARPRAQSRRRTRRGLARLLASDQDRYPQIAPPHASPQDARAAAAIATLAARPPTPPRHPLDPRRLAARLEALMRVVADPAPHARRLAKRLAANIRAVAARVLALIPRSRADQHGQAIDPLQAECLMALAALNRADSS